MIAVVPATAWRRMPWKNGQGETAEIAVERDDSASFRWRLSIAEVTRSGPFSAYPGVRRWITVLEGAGMRLAVGAAPPRLLRRLDPPLCFDGAAETRCELLDGPVRDFNLMLARGLDGGMEVLTGPGAWPVRDEVILLHAVGAGVAVVAAAAPIALAPADTAVIRAGAGRVTLDAGAAAILARLRAA